MVAGAWLRVRLHTRGAVDPFPCDTVPKTFLEGQGAPACVEELFPVLCHHLSLLGQFGKSYVNRDIEVGVVDKGVRSAGLSDAAVRGAEGDAW
jgi:hypothetical protein